MEQEIGRLVFIVLLVGLNLGGLSFIKINLYRLFIGFLTPLVVLMADIPFSPYFSIILVLLAVLNLILAGGELNK